MHDEAHASGRRGASVKQRIQQWFGRRASIPQQPFMVQNLEIIETIGEGSFATVARARDKVTNIDYAIKMINMASFPDVDARLHIEQEQHIMELVSGHPLIIKLLHTWEVQETKCFALEYIAGGDLFEILKVQRSFPSQRAARYILQLASALDYLHSKDVVFRDLKLENILLESERDEVRVADFGLAKVVPPNTTTLTICGTVQYMAPEIIQNKAYNYKVDWWSLGILAYVFLAGKYPFNKGHGQIQNNRSEQDRMIMYKRILDANIDFTDSFPHQAVDLIRQLLQADPNTRLCSGKVLEAHPWFGGQGQHENESTRTTSEVSTQPSDTSLRSATATDPPAAVELNCDNFAQTFIMNHLNDQAHQAASTPAKGAPAPSQADSLAKSQPESVSDSDPSRSVSFFTLLSQIQSRRMDNQRSSRPCPTFTMNFLQEGSDDVLAASPPSGKGSKASKSSKKAEPSVHKRKSDTSTPPSSAKHPSSAKLVDEPIVIKHQQQSVVSTPVVVEEVQSETPQLSPSVQLSAPPSAHSITSHAETIRGGDIAFTLRASDTSDQDPPPSDPVITIDLARASSSSSLDLLSELPELNADFDSSHQGNSSAPFSPPGSSYASSSLALENSVRQSMSSLHHDPLANASPRSSVDASHTSKPAEHESLKSPVSRIHDPTVRRTPSSNSTYTNSPHRADRSSHRSSTASSSKLCAPPLTIRPQDAAHVLLSKPTADVDVASVLSPRILSSEAKAPSPRPQSTNGTTTQGVPATVNATMGPVEEAHVVIMRSKSKTLSQHNNNQQLRNSRSNSLSFQNSSSDGRRLSVSKASHFLTTFGPQVVTTPVDDPSTPVIASAIPTYLRGSTETLSNQIQLGGAGNVALDPLTASSAKRWSYLHAVHQAQARHHHHAIPRNAQAQNNRYSMNLKQELVDIPADLDGGASSEHSGETSPTIFTRSHLAKNQTPIPPMPTYATSPVFSSSAMNAASKLASSWNQPVRAHSLTHDDDNHATAHGLSQPEHGDQFSLMYAESGDRLVLARHASSSARKHSLGYAVNKTFV